MAQTIHFNTGRLYTADGQRITATLHDDNVVTFYDHDRGVDGMFELEFADSFCKLVVIWYYDNNKTKHNRRSWEDGMLKGGCNSIYKG